MEILNYDLKLIKDQIIANKDNRFKLCGDYTDRGLHKQLWYDTIEDKCYYLQEVVGEVHVYCNEKLEIAELEYVISKKKDEVDNWYFESEYEEDVFTDIIAYCEMSGYFERDGEMYCEWYDIKDGRYYPMSPPSETDLGDLPF